MMVEKEKLDLVLLIDDDDVVNILNTIIIRQTGLVEEIQAVTSGENGIDRLIEYQSNDRWPSIIFVDLNMPGVCGWGFLDLFQEKFNGNKKNCTICVLSSSLDPRDREKAAKSRLVDFYFSKPLTDKVVSELCDKINQSKGSSKTSA